jgi:dienelactone hydrolase
MKLAWMCLALLIVPAIATADDKNDKPVDPFVKAITAPLVDRAEAHGQIYQEIMTRIPAATCPDTADAWTEQARDLRRRVLDEVVYKGTPAEWIDAKPEVKWLDTIETDQGYKIRKLLYEGYPGLWIPALLYEPNVLSGKVPAVYNTNGHVGAEGKAIGYKQLRCINLAKRGMLALNPEWIGMGQLTKGYNHSHIAYLDLCGRSGLGALYMSMQRALDVLIEHPHADPERVAVTGLSGGGWQTILISSLDERVKLSAPNAGYSGVASRLDHTSDIGDLEQIPSDLLRFADYTHLTAMLAPRPTLQIYNENDNCCFKAARAKASIHDPILPFYRLYGATQELVFHENKDPGTHNYDLDNRQQFYRFINQHWLAPAERVNDEIASADEIRTFDELASPLPEDNATFQSLALAVAKDLPKRKLPDAAGLADYQQAGRVALTKLVGYERISAVSREVGAGSDGAYRFSHYRVHVDDAWTLPATVLTKSGASPDGVAIVVSDEGRAGAADLKRKLADEGQRVIALDVLFVGECIASHGKPGFFGQLIGTVGRRPLGIQASQLAAAARLAARKYGVGAVTLVGAGRTSSVVALTAAALEPAAVDRLVTVDLPVSLELLIEENESYNDHPSLFCFGLLEQFDIPEMLGLVVSRQVDLIKTAGDKERVEAAIKPVQALSKAAGGRTFKLHRESL